MRTTGDISDLLLSNGPPRKILPTMIPGASSIANSTMSCGMQVFSRIRNFSIIFRFFDIVDGKKVYSKWAGVNEPMAVI